MKLAIDGFHPAVCALPLFSPEQQVAIANGIMTQRAGFDKKIGAVFAKHALGNHGISPNRRRSVKSSPISNYMSNYLKAAQEIQKTYMKPSQIVFKAVPRWRKGTNWPPNAFICSLPVDQSVENTSINSHSNSTVTPISNTLSNPNSHNVQFPVINENVSVIPQFNSGMTQICNYSERKLKCGRSGCRGGTETSHMQLHTDEGYRNVQCTACKKQSRANKWQCSHGILWHRCAEHRIDPCSHSTTRKAVKSKVPPLPSALQPSTRPEPRRKIQRSDNRMTRKDLKREPAQIVSEDVTLFQLNPAKCPRLAEKFKNSALFTGTETQLGGQLVQESVALAPLNRVVQNCTEHTAPTLYRSAGVVSPAGGGTAVATGAASQRASSSSPVHL